MTPGRTDLAVALASALVARQIARRRKAARDETRALLEDALEDARRIYRLARRLPARTQKDRFDDLPRPLRWLVRELMRRLGEMFEGLRLGDLPISEWFETVRRTLAEHHLAAWMAGAGTEVIPARAFDRLVSVVNAQLEFLRDFRVEIQGEREFAPGLQARAESYAEGVKVDYWQGSTRVLPLPEMPGSHTLQCGERCNCKWRIETIDRTGGDYDAYWELDAASEHCQSCIENGAQWFPLRIRDGVLL